MAKKDYLKNKEMTIVLRFRRKKLKSASVQTVYELELPGVDMAMLPVEAQYLIHNEELPISDNLKAKFSQDELRNFYNVCKTALDLKWGKEIQERQQHKQLEDEREALEG